jgi:hypothetical protein
LRTGQPPRLSFEEETPSFLLSYALFTSIRAFIMARSLLQLRQEP